MLNQVQHDDWRHDGWRDIQHDRGRKSGASPTDDRREQAAIAHHD